MSHFASTSAIEMELSDAGTAPEWIKLFPLGSIPARDGRQWHIPDLAKAQAIIAKTRAWYGSADPFVDYDHQIVATLKQAPGASARAAGWITALKALSDGIWARVDWTPAAAQAIANKEYRYVSPYFLHDDHGTVTEIINVALVNRPALDLPALAAADGPFPFPSQNIHQNLQESTMDLKALATVLGLPDSATEEDVLAAVQAAAAAAKALSDARAALELPDDVPSDALPDALIAKISELMALKTPAASAASAAPDPARYVPRAMFDDVSAMVKTMQASATAKSASSAVTDAIAAGKLAPAQKDWALAYAQKDLAGFTAFAAAQPMLVGTSGTSALAPHGQKSGPLSPEEEDIARQLGLSPDDITKNREEQ